jgi:hypothetical protein
VRIRDGSATVTGERTHDGHGRLGRLEGRESGDPGVRTLTRRPSHATGARTPEEVTCPRLSTSGPPTRSHRPSRHGSPPVPARRDRSARRVRDGRLPRRQRAGPGGLGGPAHLRPGRGGRRVAGPPAHRRGTARGQLRRRRDRRRRGVRRHRPDPRRRAGLRCGRGGRRGRGPGPGLGRPQRRARRVRRRRHRHRLGGCHRQGGAGRPRPGRGPPRLRRGRYRPDRAPRVAGAAERPLLRRQRVRRLLQHLHPGAGRPRAAPGSGRRPVPGCGRGAAGQPVPRRRLHRGARTRGRLREPGRRHRVRRPGPAGGGRRRGRGRARLDDLPAGDRRWLRGQRQQHRPGRTGARRRGS